MFHHTVIVYLSFIINLDTDFTRIFDENSDQILHAQGKSDQLTMSGGLPPLCFSATPRTEYVRLRKSGGDRRRLPIGISI